MRSDDMEKLGVIFTLLIPVAVGISLCTRYDDSCKGENCESSFPCYHGECDIDGRCICDPCYHGKSCEEYYDLYPPLFYSVEEEVYIMDPWSSMPVYTANAYDNDAGYSCEKNSRSCDCADIVYSLIDEKNYFIISNSSGDIFIRDPNALIKISSHSIVVKAHSVYQKPGKAEHPDSSVKITFRLRKQENDLKSNDHLIAENMLSNVLALHEDNSLIPSYREKRAVVTISNNHLTSFLLEDIGGEWTQMEIGRSVHYKLTATILKTERMSMVVEIFTRQISNSSYTPTLALYDVKVGSKSDGISFTTMEPKVEMFISDHVNTVYDRAVINFGDIANKDDKGEVVVLFSVTQIRNPDTTYRQEHYVTAGAEYDDDTYVWVGQKEIIPQELKEEDAPGIIVDVTGPDSIRIDSAGVFYLDAWTSLRSDNVTVEVLLEDNEMLTVGNIAVLEFGDYYSPVPHDTYYYNDTEVGSEISCQSLSRTLPLGLMTNIGPIDKEVKDDKNKIKYTFAIYALNKPPNTGEVASFSVGIIIGKKKVWVSNINVTLTEREEDPGPKLYGSKTIAVVSSKEVYSGTLMSYTFYTEIKETNGYFTYKIKIEVPKEKDRLKMEPCGGRLVKVPLSFDVPFVACDENVEPEYDGDKTFVFTFNRIHITNQRSPPNFNDTLVAAEIAVKIPSYNQSLPGKEMTADLSVDSSEGYISITTDSVYLVNPKEQPVPTASVKNAAGWDTLYADGAISFNIAVSISSGVGYENLIFETSGEEDEILQICRIELISAGINLPCVRMHREDINQDITYSMLPSEEGRTKNNRAVMLFGDVGAMRRLEDKEKNTLIVNVIASLIPGSEFESDSTYAMTAGLIITSKSIWAAEVNYTMSTDVRTIPPEKKPIAAATITTEKVVAGYVAEVLITINVAPNSIGKYKIILEAVDDKSSVCIVRVKTAGRNLPCVDLDTPAKYFPHADRDKGIEMATIEFKALSNVGKTNSNHTSEDNALVILVNIQIAKDATDDRKIRWKVDYGSGQLEDELVIPLSSESPPEMYGEDPKSANFSTLPPDITEVAAGVPLFLTLDFELKKFFLAPLTIKAFNPVASKHPYEVCLAGIASLGVNYPCFSSSNMVTTIPSPGSTFTDSADIYFGMVCNTYFDRENVSENAIQLRVAIRPVEDKKTLGKDISITEHIVIGNRTLTNLPIIQAKVVKEVPNINIPERILVKAINGSDIPIKVRERIWVPFNITIPPDSILKVSVKASAPFKDARAIMTVHGLRLVSGGPNIPCPLASANFEPTLSSEVPTAQNTTIGASLGYIGNLGITHINGALGLEGDDDITVEVEVELADHPEAEHGKEYYLDFVVNVDYLESVAKQTFIVDRTGEEKADLYATVLVDGTNIYPSGSVIHMYAALHHTNISTAEPHDVTVRLFIPPYTVFFTEVYSHPTKPTYKNDSGGLDIIFPLLTFPDEVEVNFTILADPYKQRKHGKGVVLATTPYRILCLQTVHSQPKQNPEKDSFFDCAPMDHLLYEINSAECDSKLGIDDPTVIEDCQLTASAAASRDWAPFNARIGATNGKGWSPPIRIGNLESYLQVDFLRTVRVGRIVLEEVDGTYSITQYEFLYSDNAIDWITAIKVLDVIFVDGLSTKYLPIPVRGRFFRLKILKREGETDLTKYVGIRIELYGCVVDNEITERCKDDPTWYTDDKKTVGRHIAVHGESGMGYFCEILDDPSEKICYSSADGQKWYVLPQNIGSILGYDPGTKLIYVVDKRDWACMATNDSLNWIAIKKADCEHIQGKGSFVSRKNIPALPKGDLGVISDGIWKANAESLAYSGVARVKWNQCCKT